MTTGRVIQKVLKHQVLVTSMESKGFDNVNEISAQPFTKINKVLHNQDYSIHEKIKMLSYSTFFIFITY